jgi:N4-gp56 family major capsid protein
MPSPATTVVSNMTATPGYVYDRQAAKTLFANLAFYDCANKKNMPENNGTVIQLHSYNNFTFSTSTANEGTVGAGLTHGDAIASITLTEFSDFVTFSRKVKTVGLSDVISSAAQNLGYRAARIVDRVTVTAVDTEAGTDSATTALDQASGVYMSAEISRQAASSLEAIDAPPQSGAAYSGVCHPLVWFDLSNDPSAGGYLDLQRYIGAQKLAANVGSQPGEIGGVRWVKSSVVPTSTTFFYNYVFGDEAVFVASLGKTPTGGKNFAVDVANYQPGTNQSDPAGTIAAGCSYWFLFGAQTRPNVTNTFRRFKTEASIS